jgi:transcriptional regulator with XRE-family HTH domain
MKGRLKIFRKALELNQSEFRKKIGISDTAISHMEAGRSAINAQNVNLICALHLVLMDIGCKPVKVKRFLSKEGVPGEEELIAIYRDPFRPKS